MCILKESFITCPMPTKLDRVQVLFQKEIFKKLKLIAKFERRSLSSMVGSIVEKALESPEYKALLFKANANDLKSKVDESKLLIKDILEPNIQTFDVNDKLKKIDQILSQISKSNQNEYQGLSQGNIRTPSK